MYTYCKVCHLKRLYAAVQLCQHYRTSQLLNDFKAIKVQCIVAIGRLVKASIDNIAKINKIRQFLSKKQHCYEQYSI